MCIVICDQEQIQKNIKIPYTVLDFPHLRVIFGELKSQRNHPNISQTKNLEYPFKVIKNSSSFTVI